MMTHSVFFSLMALGLIGMGAYGVIAIPHLLRKVIALNIASSGIFMLLVSLAARTPGAEPDPVPHAMVLTGIVVSVSASALLLALIRRYAQITGHTSLPEQAAREEDDGV